MPRIRTESARRWLAALREGKPISIKHGNLHFRADGTVYSYATRIGFATPRPWGVDVYYDNRPYSRTTAVHQSALRLLGACSYPYDMSALTPNWRIPAKPRKEGPWVYRPNLELHPDA